MRLSFAHARAWGVLVVVWLVCLPPMVVQLGRRDATHTMERVALITSQETWFAQHGRNAAAPAKSLAPDPWSWLMPTLDGLPRVRKPPGVVWANMLAWGGLDAHTAGLAALIFRARLLAVVMGLLVIGGTFWAGMSLGGSGRAGLELAVIGGLAAGTTWFFERQARTASYDIHMVAWVTLAVAAGLWAMRRPLGTGRGGARRLWRRWGAGWGTGAVCLAAAFYVKGPLSLVVTLLPLGAMIAAIRPDARAPSEEAAQGPHLPHWRSGRVNLLGLAAMTCAALILVLPWYVYAAAHVPESWHTWTTEYEATRQKFQVPWYYLGLLGLLAPWTVWLIAGLLFPFLRRGLPGWRVRLLPWLWFVVIFVFFSIPGAKQQRYILPIVPAAALVIGQLFVYHGQLADRGEIDPGVNVLRVPHWAALIGVSLLIGPFLYFQRQMVDAGWFAHLPIGPLPTLMIVLASVLLTAIAVVGARLHWQWRPRSAALATGGWTVVLMTLLWRGYAFGPTGVQPIRPDVAVLHRQVGDHRLYYLDPIGRDVRVDMALLLYSRRIVPSITRADLASLSQKQGRPFYVLAAKDMPRAELTAAGGVPVAALPGALSVPARLWRFRGDVRAGRLGSSATRLPGHLISGQH